LSELDSKSRTAAAGGNEGRNIVLTGASGSGKSTIGRHLAILIGAGFVDLDDLIERTVGKKVGTIMDIQGEPVFREYERNLLASLQGVHSLVVAVGGGTLMSTEAIEMARKIGPIVWIQSAPSEIARRISKRPGELEKRPLFRDLLSEKNDERRRELIQERMEKMMEERIPWYKQADVVLDGSYVTPEMAAQNLKEILVSERLISVALHRFASWHREGAQ
jgi:shikimate kinase